MSALLVIMRFVVMKWLAAMEHSVGGIVSRHGLYHLHRSLPVTRYAA